MTKTKLPHWLCEALENPSVTDICINGPGQAFVDVGEGLKPVILNPTATKVIDQEALQNWILSELSRVGKTWNARFPFLDATLQSGLRLHVAFPPLTSHGWVISLRKLASSSCRQPQIHDWSQTEAFRQLCQAVRERQSILISGATGSGKTTLLNDLLSQVAPTDRMIALEDTPELGPNHPHFVSLYSRPPSADGIGEVSLRMLLKQALRMRPDRLILGECRGDEVLDLLQAMNTGHPGTLTTIHANSPREALHRIELLIALSSHGNLSQNLVRELLSQGLKMIVQLERHRGSRTISQICLVEGREGNTILLRPVLNSLQHAKRIG